jgi:triosephosphate isomerase
MRKKIVAANWKMNMGISEGVKLVEEIAKENMDLQYNERIIICPPATHLDRISNLISTLKNDKIVLGAQNCFDKPQGAFTGEVSVTMLKELNVRAVILGHSERRQYFNETNETIKNKVDAVLVANILPIFCCGEPLDIRESNTQNDYVKTQIEESLFHLSGETVSNHLVIAYEPIWAIGTGKTASTEQAQEMHSYIRSLISKQYGNEVAEQLSILYGGSCNDTNAKELFACDDVDGGLIGGASLKATTFMPIVNAMH